MNNSHWHVGAQNDILYILDGPPSPAPYDGPIPKESGPSVIATLPSSDAESRSNAFLLAAAPELLKCVEDSLSLSIALPMGLRGQFEMAVAKSRGGA